MTPCWLIAVSCVLGQTSDPSDIEDLSLESLLNDATTVASTTSVALRESPGVLTVLTRDEMLRAGVRDLMEALALVPGFQFAVSSDGVASVGVRGNLADDGKILLMIDGLEQNELLYNSVQLGNHYSMDQIERIEIIRGPGSAIYGGFAELAVINVITRAAANINGASVSGVYAQANGEYARRNVTASYGQVFDSGLNLSMNATVGQGHRSNRTYTDVYGDSFNMTGNNNIDPMLVTAQMSYKGWSAHLVVDDYKVGTRDGADAILLHNYQTSFRTAAADVKYTRDLTENLSFNVKAAYKIQQPWLAKGPFDPADAAATYVAYDKTAQRMLVEPQLCYQPFAQLSILAGAQARLDLANNNLPGDATPFGNGKLHVNYENYAGYAQALWDTFLVNIAAGLRFEHNSAFGNSLVPRGALTKVIGDFHFKLLASRAFKAPGIENIALNPSIRPERTDDFELELGYLVTKSLFLTVNGFDATIHHPIVYSYDTTSGAESYLNFDRTGSRGVEGQARFETTHLRLIGSYAFYTGGRGDVALFNVPGHDSQYLGFASHQFTFNGSVELIDRLWLSVSGWVLLKRYAVASVDADGNSAFAQLKATTMLNAYVYYRGAFAVQGLDIGLGVNNALNQHYALAQPYNEGHAPLPMMGTEATLRVAYALPF